MDTIKFILDPKTPLGVNILFMLFHVTVFFPREADIGQWLIPCFIAAHAIVSLVAFTMDTNSARKVVLGNGLGYLLITSVLTGYFLWYRFVDSATGAELPPVPGLGVFGGLAVWMLFAGFMKDRSEKELLEEES